MAGPQQDGQDISVGVAVAGSESESVAQKHGYAARMQRWLPLLVKFTSVQAVVQVLGFASGILIVRNLPKSEYALYTLGNTMLAMVLVLADSGITSALSAIGGRVWNNRRALGTLLNTALRLRRLMAFATILVVIPILGWLLRRNGASVPVTAIIVLVVLVGSGFEVVTRVYAVALRLRSEIRVIQNQALVGGVIKFGLVAALMFVWFNATVAILTVVAAYIVQYWMLRSWAVREIDVHAPSDPEMRTEIIGVVKRQAPHSIYYCVQGQITVWLISIFGNAESVANVGALGRLAVVFSILATVTSEIVFPAFARIQDRRTLRKRYWETVLAYGGLVSLLLIAIAAFPNQILWVLGSQYGRLRSELILMGLSAVLSSLSGLLLGLNSARAWIVSPRTYIPILFVVQVVLVFMLRLDTVRGVLLFSIYSVLPAIIWAAWYAHVQMNSFATETATKAG